MFCPKMSSPSIQQCTCHVQETIVFFCENENMSIRFESNCCTCGLSCLIFFHVFIHLYDHGVNNSQLAYNSQWCFIMNKQVLQELVELPKVELFDSIKVHKVQCLYIGMTMMKDCQTRCWHPKLKHLISFCKFIQHQLQCQDF